MKSQRTSVICSRLQPVNRNELRQYGVVCFLMLFAMALSTSAQQSSSPSAPMSTKTQQALAPESPISGTKAVIKVVAVKDNAAPATEYEKPDAGKKLVAVQVIVDNRAGNEDLDVSGTNFKVKDEEGGVYDVSLSDSSDQPTLKSGSVESGELVKGWITFELPVTVKTAKLRIRYEFVDSKSGWIPFSILK